jgi:membrane protein DedA with SNARE-associated domain
LLTLDELLILYDYFGYPGILLMSFIISILFIIPIPYFPIPLVASFNENLDPHLISLSGTVGAVAAKMIIFYLSYSGRNIIVKRSKGKTLSLQKLLSKYGWIGAFVAAVTPISGNLIYITLGLSKYKPWKFATAIFAGELFYNEIIVWTGVFGIIISTASIVIGLYLLVKVNWDKIIGKWFPWTISTTARDNDVDRERKKTD